LDTLYISDLDGTLLNSDAIISEFSKSTLNRLIADGLNFTIATARARETTMELLSGITLKHPLILMNGVLIYDPIAERFLNVEYLGTDTSKQIAQVFAAHNTTGLMYKLIGNETVTHFESLALPQLKAFYDDRAKNKARKFAKSVNFVADIDEHVIYFVLIDKREPLLKLKQDIEKIPNITTTMYRDIYTEDLYFFEVFSATASKANAALYLKKHLGADKLISFGDNYNDISLFQVSDFCYATANAKQQLKDIASATIDSCTCDAVAKFLIENHRTTPSR
jgi:5-amino-6-(5-phospho-D-ribitylamino)uracil phosphatase